MRHRGHGHTPRLRMFAIKTLLAGHQSSESNLAASDSCILLWIVCRISENSWEESSFNAITTSEHDAMFVRLNKFIVEKCLPLRMEQFTATMREEGVTWQFAARVL